MALIQERTSRARRSWADLNDSDSEIEDSWALSPASQGIKCRRTVGSSSTRSGSSCRSTETSCAGQSASECSPFHMPSEEEAFPDVLLAEINSVASRLKQLARAPPLPGTRQRSVAVMTQENWRSRPPPGRAEASVVAALRQEALELAAEEAAHQAEAARLEAQLAEAQAQDGACVAAQQQQAQLREHAARAEKKAAANVDKATAKLEEATVGVAAAVAEAARQEEKFQGSMAALRQQLAVEVAFAESAEREAAKAAAHAQAMEDLPAMRKRRQAAEASQVATQSACRETSASMVHVRSEIDATLQLASARAAVLEHRIVQLERESKAEEAPEPECQLALLEEAQASNRQLLASVREARQSRDKWTKVLAFRQKELDEAKEITDLIARAGTCKPQDACVIA